MLARHPLHVSRWCLFFMSSCVTLCCAFVYRTAFGTRRTNRFEGFVLPLSSPNVQIENLETKKSSVILRSLRETLRKNQSLTADDLDVLRIAIHSQVDMMTEYELSDCLWCMGYLKLEMQPVALALVNMLHLKRKSVTLKSIDIAKAFLGVANMGKISWNDVSTYMLDLIDDYVESFEAQSISNILWSMGKLGASKESVPKGTRIQLLRQLHSKLPSMNDQGFSLSLWGLYKLGYQWKNIPEVLRDEVCKTTSCLCFRMSPQALGNTLFALAKLGVKAKTAPTSFTMAFELAIRKSGDVMLDKDVMQVLQSLGIMAYSWGDFSPETRAVLSTALYKRTPVWTKVGPSSAVEVATIFHSFVALRIRWTDLPAQVKATLLVGLTALTDFDRSDAIDAIRNKTAYIINEKAKFGAVPSPSAIATKSTTRGENTRESYVLNLGGVDSAITSFSADSEDRVGNAVLGAVVTGISSNEEEERKGFDSEEMKIHRFIDSARSFCNAVTNDVRGLAGLGVSMASLPDAARNSLWTAIGLFVPLGASAQALYVMTSSLARMQVRYRTLDNDLAKERDSSRSSRQQQRLNLDQSSSHPITPTAFAGKREFDTLELPGNCRRAIMSALLRIMNDEVQEKIKPESSYSRSEIVAALMGLGKMGFLLDRDFSNTLERSEFVELLRRLIFDSETWSADDSSGGCGADYDERAENDSVRDNDEGGRGLVKRRRELLAHPTKTHMGELSGTLQALSSMKAKWSDLPSSFRSQTLRYMSHAAESLFSVPHVSSIDEPGKNEGTVHSICMVIQALGDMVFAPGDNERVSFTRIILKVLIDVDLAGLAALLQGLVQFEVTLKARSPRTGAMFGEPLDWMTGAHSQAGAKSRIKAVLATTLIRTAHNIASANSANIAEDNISAASIDSSQITDGIYFASVLKSLGRMGLTASDFGGWRGQRVILIAVSRLAPQMSAYTISDTLLGVKYLGLDQIDAARKTSLKDEISALIRPILRRLEETAGNLTSQGIVSCVYALSPGYRYSPQTSQDKSVGSSFHLLDKSDNAYSRSSSIYFLSPKERMDQDGDNINISRVLGETINRSAPRFTAREAHSILLQLHLYCYSYSDAATTSIAQGKNAWVDNVFQRMGSHVSRTELWNTIALLDENHADIDYITPTSDFPDDGWAYGHNGYQRSTTTAYDDSGGILLKHKVEDEDGRGRLTVFAALKLLVDSGAQAADLRTSSKAVLVKVLNSELSRTAGNRGGSAGLTALVSCFHRMAQLKIHWCDLSRGTQLILLEQSASYFDEAPKTRTRTAQSQGFYSSLGASGKNLNVRASGRLSNNIERSESVSRSTDSVAFLLTLAQLGCTETALLSCSRRRYATRVLLTAALDSVLRSSTGDNVLTTLWLRSEEELVRLASAAVDSSDASIERQEQAAMSVAMGYPVTEEEAGIIRRKLTGLFSRAAVLLFSLNALRLSCWRGEQTTLKSENLNSDLSKEDRTFFEKSIVQLLVIVMTLRPIQTLWRKSNNGDEYCDSTFDGRTRFTIPTLATWRDFAVTNAVEDVLYSLRDLQGNWSTLSVRQQKVLCKSLAVSLTLDGFGKYQQQRARQSIGGEEGRDREERRGTNSTYSSVLAALNAVAADTRTLSLGLTRLLKRAADDSTTRNDDE